MLEGDVEKKLKSFLIVVFQWMLKMNGETLYSSSHVKMAIRYNAIQNSAVQ